MTPQRGGDQLGEGARSYIARMHLLVPRGVLAVCRAQGNTKWAALADIPASVIR